MPLPDESAAAAGALVAVVLPPVEAAPAIRQIWDRSAAVAVIDPRAPDPASLLVAIAPTHVLDADGERSYPGGREVPTSTAAVVTTSGTTGAPRAVMLDHAALAHSARAVTAALDLDPARHRWLGCLPLHHVAGLAIVARSYVTGAALVVHDRFDADAVAATADDATVVSLVPTTLGRLVDAHPDAVARFHRILLGGAPVPDELRAAVDRVGAAVVTTYGLTETGGGCVHDGHPLAGVEIDLEPTTDEILVRGPVLMQGYRTAPEPDPGADADADAELRPDGTLATGDIGQWGADGRLEVVDRIKDLIITGGINVSPTRVERALLADGHGGLVDVAVVGLPDPEWGERVVAWVVPGPDQPPSLDRVRALGREAGLSQPELPREVRVTDAVPRSPGGKVLRRVLRARGGDGFAHDGGS